MLDIAPESQRKEIAGTENEIGINPQSKGGSPLESSSRFRLASVDEECN